MGSKLLKLLAPIICTEISLKIFRQTVSELFFALKTGMGLSCTICKMTRKFFAFSREEGWYYWKSKQMVQKISVVPVKAGER